MARNALTGLIASSSREPAVGVPQDQAVRRVPAAEFHVRAPSRPSNPAASASGRHALVAYVRRLARAALVPVFPVPTRP